jgi:hypothetical protein
MKIIQFLNFKKCRSPMKVDRLKKKREVAHENISVFENSEMVVRP